MSSDLLASLPALTSITDQDEQWEAEQLAIRILDDILNVVIHQQPPETPPTEIQINQAVDDAHAQQQEEDEEDDSTEDESSECSCDQCQGYDDYYDDWDTGLDWNESGYFD